MGVQLSGNIMWHPSFTMFCGQDASQLDVFGRLEAVHVGLVLQSWRPVPSYGHGIKADVYHVTEWCARDMDLYLEFREQSFTA